MGLVLSVQTRKSVIKISLGEKTLYVMVPEVGRIHFEGDRDFIIKRFGTINDLQKNINKEFVDKKQGGYEK